MRETLAAFGVVLVLGGASTNPPEWMKTRDPWTGIAAGAAMMLTAALWRDDSKVEPPGKKAP